MRKIILISLMLLLSGCSQGMFNPKGTIATSEAHLFVISLLLMLIVVIPVFGMTIWFALRYRSSNTKAKYHPNWSHSTLLEVIWWTIPAILIIILSVITWRTSHQLSPYKPLATKNKNLVIQVVSLDWKWLFIYPKQHIATVNFVEFPKNTPISFKITSDAPMNSFFIPQLAGQIYAMTGMQTQLHLIANQAGSYYGMSANYSGNGFYGMHFVAKAVNSQHKFNKWVLKVKQSKYHLNWLAYQQLAKPTTNAPVKYFASVRPGLFKAIIHKYTKPKHHFGKHNLQAL